MTTDDDSSSPRGVAVAVMGVALVYSVVRYCVAGDVAWSNVPAYVVNKAVSFASVVFMALAGWCYAKRRMVRSRSYGRASVHSAFVHVALSLGLLSAGYYGKFYEADGEKLGAGGEVMLLAGACGAYVYWLLARKQDDVRRKVMLVLLSCALVGLHLVPMGVPGWWQPGGWLGGMPPVSLLSFLAVVVAAVLYKKGANASL